MFSSLFPVLEGELWINILDICLSVGLITYLIIMVIKYKLSVKVIIVTAVFTLLFILSTIFDLRLLRSLAIVFAVLFTVYYAVLLTSAEKETEIRYNKKVSKKVLTLTTNETDELVSNLQKAIDSLSITQTGALITIERSDDLTSFMAKTGTKVSAPVTPEMLETIFYKGTPLHDGATIIRGNMIIASAVFYQPTQRPLNGKFGSRHRAAIGISEICDAITIVVSEETGKVSIAYKGELVTVPVSQFSEKLKEFYYIDKK